MTLVAFGAAVPEARAARRPRVQKSIDVSDDPSVKAAKKAHDDATHELESAKEKNDKAAIEAAQKKHDETEKALTKARNEAFNAAKNKKR